MDQGRTVWRRAAVCGQGRTRGRARRAAAFTWTVLSALGAEIGCLLLDGAPLPLAMGLLTLAGAQGYIVRERGGRGGGAAARAPRDQGLGERAMARGAEREP